MPLQYEGILAEYESTRRQSTVFDTSHMGEFLITGDCQENGLDRIVTQPLNDMPHKTCRYGMALNASGGIRDDLIVYRIADGEWMIVVNAGTCPKMIEHFTDHLTSGALFQDISSQTGKLDIQGPSSREALKTIVPGIEKLDYYTFDYFEVLGQRVIVSRTGYTGELGYEIYFPWERTPELWREILKNPDVKPAGLGARDVLRLEMGYSLYGHELEETVSPLEARLMKFVDLEKDFLGRDALWKQREHGAGRKLIPFISETRRSPRQHHPICTPSLEPVGTVTSGSFSPALQKGIGMGFISQGDIQEGQNFLIGDEKNKIKACWATRPFYKKGSLKS